jgi:nitrogen regulatory protein P-II 1
MKLIIAIIPPHKLESVKASLRQVDVTRLTIMDCQGYGRQRGNLEPLGADDVERMLKRKIQLQIAVNEEFVEPTIHAIQTGAQADSETDDATAGDGKIFVVPLDDCVRIRTGERGPDAI